MSSMKDHHFPHSLLPRWWSWWHGRDLSGTVFFTSLIISCSAIPFIFLTPSLPIPFLFPLTIFFSLSRLPLFLLPFSRSHYFLYCSVSFTSPPFHPLSPPAPFLFLFSSFTFTFFILPPHSSTRFTYSTFSNRYSFHRESFFHLTSFCGSAT